MKAFILTHQRGNHSPEQVYYHGKIVFEGTKKECRQELARMRKFCKNKYYNTSTNDTLKDFVEYEMGDTFFVTKKDNQIVWA